MSEFPKWTPTSVEEKRSKHVKLRLRFTHGHKLERHNNNKLLCFSLSLMEDLRKTDTQWTT